MSKPSSQELQAELTKLRALIAQTREMGLAVEDLEARAAEIEAQIANTAGPAGADAEGIGEAAPAAAEAAEAGTLRILTPNMNTGDWANRPVVLVGGAAATLPDHRAAVMEACVGQGMFPIAVGQLPAADAEAIQASLTIVDNVHVYVGIFAYRYGRAPGGHVISIAEMEYDRAVERGILRLVFLMGQKHPVDPDDVERGEGAVKLTTFKARLRDENEVYEFTSVDDLRAQVVAALTAHRATQPRSG